MVAARAGVSRRKLPMAGPGGAWQEVGPAGRTVEQHQGDERNSLDIIIMTMIIVEYKHN